MKIILGTVTGQEIKQNRDGDHPVRLLQVEFAPDDVQTVEWMANSSGDDSAPPVGSRVLVLAISTAYKVAIGIDDEIDPEVEAGERKLYSSENGAIKAFAYFKKDGGIVVENENGFFKMESNGQFNANDNFTVDP